MPFSMHCSMFVSHTQLHTGMYLKEMGYPPPAPFRGTCYSALTVALCAPWSPNHFVTARVSAPSRFSNRLMGTFDTAPSASCPFACSSRMPQAMLLLFRSVL